MGSIQEVGGNVFCVHYDFFDFNVGLIVGAEGILVVDTRASHRQGRELREDIRRITPLPVKWVINTHYHWDHTWGNAEYTDSEIWGHALCRHNMVEHGEDDKAAVIARIPEQLAEELAIYGRTPEEYREELNEVTVTPPEKTFALDTTIDLGGQHIDLKYLGRAHTDSDITVTVREAGVVFAGDLIEEGGPPAFRDSFPLEWPSTAQLLLDAMPDVAVPGHGRSVERSFVKNQIEELAGVAELVAQCTAGELDPTQAASMGPYPGSPTEHAIRRGVAQPNNNLA